MKRHTLSAVTLAGVLTLAACSDTATNPLDIDAAPAERRAAANAGAPAPGENPIAAIAIDAGFSELVGALVYVDGELETGLVDLFLNGTDQYTVFAPTNEAFENLYSLLSDVLDTEINEITDVPADVVLNVLLYHVTEGRRAAVSVVPPRNWRTITPLLGETFAVRTDATIVDGLTGLRDDAQIVSADISASNGIIHVIDQVIVPPSVVAALTS
jgi:uncharacterized surface protein with fasciclin (FAS1) repeats